MGAISPTIYYPHRVAIEVDRERKRILNKLFPESYGYIQRDKCTIVIKVITSYL